MRRYVFAILVAGAGIAACGASSSAPPATAPAKPQPYGIDLQPVATWVNPCEDFQGFACEGTAAPWERMHRPGDLVAARNEGIERFADEVVAGQHRETPGVSAELRDYLTRCLDPVARKAGLAELGAELDGLSRAETFDAFARALGHLRSVGLRILVDLDLGVREGDAKKQLDLTIGFGAPVLPNRFYAPVIHWTVHQNRAHWERLAKLSGVATTQDAADAARVDRWLAVERPKRSAQSAEKPLSRADLERRRFPWKAYFEGLGKNSDGPFGVDNPGDLDHVDSLLALPLPVLKSYVRVLVLESWGMMLSPEMLAEEERFHMATLNGFSAEARPLREACPHITVPDFKQRLELAYLSSLADRTGETSGTALFHLVRARLIARIARAVTVSSKTRHQVVESLERLRPFFTEDWSPPPEQALTTPDSGSLFSLYRRERTEETGREMARVGQPWKGPSWNGWPTYYSPAAIEKLSGSLWLSPEILRAPYLRSPPWSPATYGGLGATLGHEVAHLLPNELRFVRSAAPFVPPATDRAREDPYPCLAQHMAGVAGDWEIRFDARNSADEYTADLIGLDLALEVMRGERFRASSDAESYWQDTRELFVAFAQDFCASGGEFTSELDVRTDPHPSRRIRINGVISEMPEFARAFSCEPGQPMAPVQRCVAW
jgi:endothelin-converting enzyme/putative endopeptidase